MINLSLMRALRNVSAPSLNEPEIRAKMMETSANPSKFFCADPGALPGHRPPSTLSRPSAVLLKDGNGMKLCCRWMLLKDGNGMKVRPCALGFPYTAPPVNKFPLAIPSLG